MFQSYKEKDHVMASVSMSSIPSATDTAFAEETTPAQGALLSAAAGITAGYTGDSLPLKIIISVLIGLSLYNAVELIILVLVTFQRYHGLYFWSLLIAGFGVLPYSLGFLIKFFQLLDPNNDPGYVAVVLLTIGWWTMVSGQSVVLWSRLHLLTNSRKTLRWTLYMIIINGTLLHSITTVLTFASNSNNLTNTVLQRFVNGYSIMEKIQMTGFFLQELILSVIYIRETIRLLRLGESVNDDVNSFDDGTLRNASVRKTMYQILAINVIIILMDAALLATEYANLYLIETTLKGVVYSIKLKLEFAVLGKLVQIVRVRTSSKNNSPLNATGSGDRRGTSTGLTLEKTKSGDSSRNTSNWSTNARSPANPHGSLSLAANSLSYPDFVDPRRFTGDFTHARADVLWRSGEYVGWENETETERERWRRRSRGRPRGSWIDEEMDKFNIG